MKKGKGRGGKGDKPGEGDADEWFAGRGEFKKGDSDKEGPGLGGPGRGRGGVAPKAPEDVGLEKTKIKGRLGKGSAATLGFFRGDPAKASPTVEYTELYSDYQEEAKDALTKEEIPLGQKEFVKEYFESIRPKQKD